MKKTTTPTPRKTGAKAKQTATTAATAASSPKHKAEFIDPKSSPVLLAVTGMSPAVLTETIWALAHEPEPVIPSRVIVLTTSTGRDTLCQRLFTPSEALHGQTPWQALREALQREGHDLTDRLRFGHTSDDIRVITALDPSTHESAELPDLRSLADNDAAADFLLEHVRAIVENPDTPLIASIAGGRKTMGALLYACMTLIGRETDRVTHVLVNEPYETLPDFWFPAQPGGPVRDRNGQTHDPAQARLDLADVPFIPLRNLFKRELGRPAGRFGALVESCRLEIRRHIGETLRLTIEKSRTELEVNGARVKLAPREHLVLLFLATRAKQGEPALGSYIEALTPLNEFRTQLLESMPADNFGDWRHSPSLQKSFNESDDEDLRKLVSSLRDKLRKASGDAPALAQCLPERGRFSLEVPGSLIHIKP